MIPGPALAPAAVRTTLLVGVHPGVRILGAGLAVATLYLLPPVLAVPAAAAVALLAAAAGLGPRRQAAGLVRWWPVAVLVLAVHALTHTAAAPLGRPSWAGLAAGAVALLRIAAAAGVLAVLVRTTGLDELVGGLRWCTGPLRRLGWRDEDLGLVLAVALGTAPALLGEARRVAAVGELRRHGPAGAPRRGPLARVRDRAAVVVPLLEALGRRAEALSLSLRRRRPRDPDTGRPPAGQVAIVVLWSLALVALTALRGPAARW
ncbi:MAG: CbiQ family ECF transporter T component [Candidatus Krumholzibacteriia bacterium]